MPGTPRGLTVARRLLALCPIHRASEYLVRSPITNERDTILLNSPIVLLRQGLRSRFASNSEEEMEAGCRDCSRMNVVHNQDKQ